MAPLERRFERTAVTLAAGTRLGPYEILDPLGAGGMGEVYRARDARLGRDVAIKVLPPALAADADRLRRFEKEARAASALNHPNIVTIYDAGTTDGVSWIAMEHIEGQNLRTLLILGALSPKKRLSYAAQVAEGLAKAHESGIVHRDLKPENVMVTRDGAVKILDFGLAKLVEPSGTPEEQTQSPTVSAGTQVGVVLGTVGYMSPEQAKGETLDFRSDQFSFGSILYELLTGKRAFARANAPETMAAIIREEPEPLAAAAPETPVALRWIVERCLAKEAEERYASTRDLARDLARVRDALTEGTLSASVGAMPAARRLPRWILPLAAAALLAAAAIAFLVSRRTPASPPLYRPLTFQRGALGIARFAPDEQTILYAAAWQGHPAQLYSTRLDSTESTALPLPSASLLSVSSSGKLAIKVIPRDRTDRHRRGLDGRRRAARARRERSARPPAVLGSDGRLGAGRGPPRDRPQRPARIPDRKGARAVVRDLEGHLPEVLAGRASDRVHGIAGNQELRGVRRGPRGQEEGPVDGLGNHHVPRVASRHRRAVVLRSQGRRSDRGRGAPRRFSRPAPNGSWPRTRSS